MARPRSLIDQATPLAVRMAASLRLGEQLTAGVLEVNAPASAVGADPDTLAGLPHEGLPPSVPTGEVADPVGHGRTFCEDQDSELPRRFIDGLMLVQGSRTSPGIAEPHDWRAVTEVVGGSGGLPAEQGLVLLEHACAAR